MAIDTELDPDPDPEWDDDESELDPKMSDADDELEFSDFDDADIDIETAAETEDVTDRTPLWRLIEMSREDRNLRNELADFEDYDLDEMAW